MIQFYFLSVFFNALTGYLLAFENDGEDSIVESDFRLSLKNGTIRLVLGILTMATGLLKILSSVQGDLPVIGDILPALTGLGAGFLMIFEFYRSRSILTSEKSELLEGFLLKNRKWIGFAALAAAVLHFLFPSVLLL
jgi:hypothetical protein